MARGKNTTAPVRRPPPMKGDGRELPPLLQSDHRRRRARGLIVLGAVVGLVAVLGLLLSSATGKVHRADWLIAQVEEQINTRLGPGAQVRFSGGDVFWPGFGQGVAMRFHDPVIALPNAVLDSAVLSDIELVFSETDILRGALRPRKVVLNGPVLELDLKNGTPGDVAPAQPTNPEPDAALRPTQPGELAVIRDLEAALNQGAARILGLVRLVAEQGVERLAIRNGTLTVLRGADQPPFKVLDVDALAALDGGLALEATSFIEERQLRTPVTFSFVTDEEGHPRTFEAMVSDIVPVEQFSAEDIGLHISSPVTTTVTTGFGNAGRLETARIRIDLGAGDIGEANRPLRRLAVDSGTIVLNLRRESGVIDVKQLDVRAGGNILRAAGTIAPWAGDPSGEQMSLSIQTQELVLDDSESDGPVVFDSASFDGVVDPVSKFALINRIALSAGEAGVAMTAEVGWGDDNQRFSLIGAFSEVSVAKMRHVWIPPIAPAPRGWFRKNVRSGVLEPGTFSLLILPPEKRRPGDPPALTSIDTVLRDVTTGYFDGLPDLTLERAHLRLDSKLLDVDGGPGFVPTDNGRIEVPGGALHMDGLGFPNPTLALKVNMAADARAFVDFARNEELRAGSLIPFEPEAVTGTATATLDLTMRVHEVEAERNVRFQVSAETADIVSETIVPDRRLSDGRLTLRFTNEGLDAAGALAVDGVPADVTLRIPLATDATTEGGRFSLAARLDDEQRRSFGLDLSAFASGPADVRIASAIGGNANPRVALDLTPTRLSVPAIGWSKPTGQKATLEFVAVDTERGQALREFAFDGPGLDLEGEIDLGADGGFEGADFNVFRLSADDRAAATIRQRDGALAIQLRGARFDARAILSRLVRREGGGGNTPFSLNASIGQLVGHNAATIDDFQLRVAQSGGIVRAFDLTGQLSGRSGIRGRVTDPGSLRVDAADGGTLLRFLDLYRWAGGGVFELQARQAPSANVNWDGVVKMTDFDVKGDPVVDRLLAGGFRRGESLRSDTNADAGPANSRIDAITFSKLRVSFNQTPARLQVTEGVVKGPVMGATFNGTLATDGGLRVGGTFVPAYGLNNAFSQIPVLGAILGGRQDEGLIGITFGVGGSITRPNIQVNPISAIAPGIFRRIFEFNPGDLPGSQSGNQVGSQVETVAPRSLRAN